MEWLWQQAQTASPFVAAFCLGAATLLWRQHVRDQATIISMSKSAGDAITKSAVAMEGLTGLIRQSLERRGRR